MLERPVVFIDSGIGGLPYLVRFREKLPCEDVAYCADTEHFPYGSRPADDVRDIVVSLAGKIIERLSPKMFVIACNTASVSALARLRSIFDVPFVGVVPAVKPAASLSKKKTIGIMATDRTVEEAYTEDLIRQFADDCKILRYADRGIVEFVEYRMLDSTPRERMDIAHRAARILGDADTVVLACTHFLHLRDELVRGFGPGVNLVDSVEGVVRQSVRVLQQIKGNTRGEGKADFYITGGRESTGSYRKYAAANGMDYKGTL